MVRHYIRSRTSGSGSVLDPLLLGPLAHLDDEVPPSSESDTPIVTLVFSNSVGFTQGVPTFSLKYLNNRRFDYHHAFTRDGSLLLTYDHEHFRVWDAITFEELGRLDVYEEMFYLFNASVSFIKDSTFRFVAFFADGPFLECSISPATDGERVLITKTISTNLKHQLRADLGSPGRVSLKFLGNNDIIAAFEYRVETEEGQELTVALFNFAEETPEWSYIFLEPDCQSGEDHSTHLYGQSLLRIEAITRLNTAHLRIRFWPKIDFASTTPDTFVTLKGCDGRFAAEGRVIITWDGSGDDKDVCPVVYLYRTSDCRSSCNHAVPNEALQAWKVVELHEGMELYYAHPIPGPECDCSRLVMLCDSSWSDKTQIVVVDIPTGAYIFELNTQFCYGQVTESVLGRRWFHSYSPFIVSADGRWLFYGYPGQTKGELFCLRNRVFVCSIEQDRVHNPLEPAFDFDPTGQLVSAQLESGLTISMPEVMKASKNTKWMVNPSSVEARVLDFIRIYDRQLFEDFISNDFGDEDIVNSDLFKWLMEPDTLQIFINSIEGFGRDQVKHVVFSPDATLVAFVLIQSPICVKFWRITGIQITKKVDLAHSFHQWNGSIDMDRRSESSLAFFHSRQDGKQEFVIINKYLHEVHLAWIDTDSFEVTEATRLWLKKVDALRRIWKDGQIVYIIENSGKEHRYDLDNRVLLGSRHFAHAVRSMGLKKYSMGWQFIHLDRSDSLNGDVFGWDFSSNSLITSVRRIDPRRRLRSIADDSDYGHVLWMNAATTRALVHVPDHRLLKLVLFDVSNERPVKILEIEGDNVPRFAWNLEELMEKNSETAVPVSPDELRTFVAYLLLSWRHQIPKSIHLNVLGIKTNSTMLTQFVSKFGKNLLNTRSTDSCQTLLHNVLINKQLDLAEGLFRLTDSGETKVDVTWNDSDLLKWAIEERDQRSMSLAFKRLLSPCCRTDVAARLFKTHFRRLMSKAPHILQKILIENDLCQTYGQFVVPVGLFKAASDGLYISTSSDIFKWSTASQIEAGWYWKRMSKEMAHALKTATGTRILAESRFVLIEDIAQVGMKGILRSLLMDRSPVEFFGTDIIKWTIQYKWNAFWRKKFLFSAIKYAVMLLCFSAYGWLVGTHKEKLDFHFWRYFFTNFFLASCWFTSFFDMIDEIRQIFRYGRDRSDGLKYYFSYLWNWIELASVCLLLFVIPTLNVIASFEKSMMVPLSGFIAFECILLWFKVLYYAQPFGSTGPLVTMIRRIMLDILFFLLLGFMVMTGFSLAFFVIFQSSEENDSFNGVYRSLETMFFAMFGDFDLETFHSAGQLTWLSVLGFIMYMMIQTIVLLNLLIAIMADTYERVKVEEDAEIMRCRAVVIDDGEAALTESEIKNMEMKIGKYLHVLVPLDRHVNNINEEVNVQAMMHSLESRLKSALSTNELKMLKNIQRLTHENSELAREVRRLKAEGDVGKADLMRHYKEGVGQIKAQVASLQWRLDSIIERLRSV